MLIINIFQIGIYGIGLFREEGLYWVNEDQISAIVFYGLIAFQVILAIWSIVILIIGLSEIQEYSIGKSILNLLAPILIIVVPFLLLFIAFELF